MRTLCNCEAKSAIGLENKQHSWAKSTQGVAVRGDNLITPFGRFELYWTERTDKIAVKLTSLTLS